MSAPYASESPSELDAVVCTAKLYQRARRPIDCEAEQRALLSLGGALAHRPGDILQRLAEAALELCGAGSAGISIIEGHQGEQVFRWHALTGALAAHKWNTTPRDFSPCGTVIDRQAVQLMRLPERHFPYIANIKPQVVEVLLVPFSVHEQLVGTIWVVTHDERHEFDAEDERVVCELGRFASAAYQSAPSVEVSKTVDRRTDDCLVTVAQGLRRPEPAIRGRPSTHLPRRSSMPSTPPPAHGSPDNPVSLLRRMRAGDQHAFELLYDCTAGSVYAFARAMLKSPEDAEEVVCDTYAQAWRQVERFDVERSTPLGWLMMMCRSRAVDRLRRNRCRGAARTIALDGSCEFAQDAPTPEELFSLFHDGSRVQAALAALSPQRLQLVSLAFFEGLSVSEIAERTGMPLGTVKSHIRRALAQLRQTMQPAGSRHARSLHLSA